MTHHQREENATFAEMIKFDKKNFPIVCEEVIMFQKRNNIYIYGNNMSAFYSVVQADGRSYELQTNTMIKRITSSNVCKGKPASFEDRY